jgi:hypothetical protein
MRPLKHLPVDSFENLRARVERLLSTRVGAKRTESATGELFGASSDPAPAFLNPTNCISEFLDFLADTIPQGDVYLFGGVLRDLALHGKRGFNSDVDLVIEGEWDHCVQYLQSIGAAQNKFGGFRLRIADWDVDVWNARETWAIRHGFVTYTSVASLNSTTVLNWDAILMNWKTKQFIARPNYLEQIQRRVLDVILVENPNPLGMLVRVLRHLCMKDARQITRRADEYLARATAQFTFDEVHAAELASYRTSQIEPTYFQFFQRIGDPESFSLGDRHGVSIPSVLGELGLEDRP